MDFSKGMLHYNEPNYSNVSKVFLDSSRSASYYKILSSYLDEVFLENNQGPRVMNYLAEEYKSLYQLIEIRDIEAAKQPKRSKELVMYNYIENLTDIDIYWYESMIKGIRDRLRADELSTDLWKYLRTDGKANLENPFLGIIYDYDKLNTLGQLVMKYAGLTSTTYYPFLAIDPTKLKDFSTKMKATKELIRELLNHPMTSVTYIFWALFILTVDHTDYEQHLSEICNLADMIGVHEIIIYDLMDIINVIYRRVAPEKVVLRSTTTEYVFRFVLGMYGIRIR